MSILGYGRVSTREKTSEKQFREIEAAGYGIDYWYADEGVSGKVSALQRPQFAEALSQIRDGDTLVVTKLDRLGRDAHDIAATINMLAPRGIEIIVLQLGKVGLSSAAGRPMLTMLVAMAEMERDLLVERTQSGLDRAKSEGKTLGRPSLTTEEQRKAMYLQHHEKCVSLSALARLNGLSRATIMRIVKPTPASIERCRISK